MNSSPPTTTPDSGTTVETLELGTPGTPEEPAEQPRRARPHERWGGVPLRVRLVGILVALLVVALALTGVATTYVLRQYLIGKVDGQLQSAVDQLAQSGGGQGYGGTNQLPTDYVVLWHSDDGSSDYQPPNPNQRTGAIQPDWRAISATQAQKMDLKPFTIGSTNGDTKWRVVAAPTTNRITGATGSVSVALTLGGVSDAVKRLTLLVSAFGLLVTAICALLGWLAIRRAFVPLTEVEETAAAIAAGDLSRRIPEHPASTEVGRLTSSLNGMLAQIESAFRSREASEQRTRRFAADASHELRTPLASIRGFAELYRQGAVREPDDVAKTMSRIEGESKRMGTLVEDLLLLARLDEQRPVRSEPVDLAVLAGDATHDARGLAADRTVTLVGLRAGRGPEPTVVIGDDNRLRQVVANLVGNAVRHTPAGSPIEVAVGHQDGRAVLEVRDHGPGLPPEHAEKVFERFYRVDSSRARTQGGGSGLGLSIVSAVVSAHGGRVGVAPTPGGGATFRVELPPAPPEDLHEPEDPEED